MERMRLGKYERLEHSGGLRSAPAIGDHESEDVVKRDAYHVNVGAMPFGGEGRRAKVLDRLRMLRPAIYVAASRYSRTEGPTQSELRPEQLSMERIAVGKKSVVEVPALTVIGSVANNSRSITNGRRVAGSCGRGSVSVPSEPQVTEAEVQMPVEAGRDHWSVPIELLEDPRYGEIALDDLLVGWERALKEREKPMSDETIHKYVGAVRSFMASLKAHKKPAILKSLSRNNVLQWLVDQRGDKVYGERLSEYGIASRLSAVKVFSNTFIFREKQLTKVDLLESVKRFQPDEKTKPGLTQEQFQKVLDHFDLKTFTGVRNRALVAVYAATGLRLSALVNLTMTRLNIATGELHVVTKGKKEHLVCLSKNALSSCVDDFGGVLMAGEQ